MKRTAVQVGYEIVKILLEFGEMRKSVLMRKANVSKDQIDHQLETGLIEKKESYRKVVISLPFN